MNALGAVKSFLIRTGKMANIPKILFSQWNGLCKEKVMPIFPKPIALSHLRETDPFFSYWLLVSIGQQVCNDNNTYRMFSQIGIHEQ